MKLLVVRALFLALAIMGTCTSAMAEDVTTADSANDIEEEYNDLKLEVVGKVSPSVFVRKCSQDPARVRMDVNPGNRNKVLRLNVSKGFYDEPYEPMCITVKDRRASDLQMFVQLPQLRKKVIAVKTGVRCLETYYSHKEVLTLMLSSAITACCICCIAFMAWLSVLERAAKRKENLSVDFNLSRMAVSSIEDMSVGNEVERNESEITYTV